VAIRGRKLDRLSALAAELVRLKVDVIVSAGPALTRSAKEATKTIPIVMTQDGDPIGSGFVASLARPGGNSPGYPHCARTYLERGWSCLEKSYQALPRGRLGDFDSAG